MCQEAVISEQLSIETLAFWDEMAWKVNKMSNSQTTIAHYLLQTYVLNLISVELIAHALNGLDMVVPHFFAHFAHVHVHGAGQYEYVITPDIF